MILFTELGPLVSFARLRAKRRTCDGREDMALMRQCAHLFVITPDCSARMIYTRDIGHHTGGWWKNPGYERCLHLSVSFCVNPTNAPLPFDKREAERIATAFFDGDVRKCWVEPPYSPEGKICGVHHYRLFCDAGWNPIIPRGEVYTRTDTPAGWKSFSEIHGFSPRGRRDDISRMTRRTDHVAILQAAKAAAGIQPPYPNCRQPHICAPYGYCRRDPCCMD